MKRKTSKTSTSSEFKLNGLSYAFTSNAIPNTAIDGPVKENGNIQCPLEAYLGQGIQEWTKQFSDVNYTKRIVLQRSDFSKKLAD